MDDPASFGPGFSLHAILCCCLWCLPERFFHLDGFSILWKLFKFVHWPYGLIGFYQSFTSTFLCYFHLWIMHQVTHQHIVWLSAFQKKLLLKIHRRSFRQSNPQLKKRTIVILSIRFIYLYLVNCFYIFYFFIFVAMVYFVIPGNKFIFSLFHVR